MLERERNKFGYSFTVSFIGVSHFVSANSRNPHFFKKYVRIKIKEQKIYVLMSRLSQKFDEIKVIIPVNLLGLLKMLIFIIDKN